MERELPHYLPAGIAISHNRLSRSTPDITKASLTEMITSLEQASRDLAMAWPQPEIIIFGCTSGSFVGGPGREDEHAENITRYTGIPACTTSGAVIRALKSLNARRVYLVTPYIDAVNAHEIAFLEHRGCEVVACDAFNCLDTRDIAKIASERVTELVLAHAATARASDAVFISCTNLLTMDQIDFLEHELGVPVLSSNQCSLWAALRHMNVDAAATAPGRLFK
jgi:maleate isomerase